MSVNISLCIPTMNRYDSFLKNNLTKYLQIDLIDEIVICDENGEDVKKIQRDFPNNNKLRLFVNERKLGAFFNKLRACKQAKNEWIALIDSDNFADVDYFKSAKEFITNKKPLKNSILAPSFAKPTFDYSIFSGMCFKKSNLKNVTNVKSKKDTILNTGNYVLNKYLIDNVKITDKDIPLTNNPCDVVFMNLLMFEQLDLQMHVIPDMYYHHIVHDGSFYKTEASKCRYEIHYIHQRLRHMEQSN